MGLLRLCNDHKIPLAIAAAAVGVYKVGPEAISTALANAMPTEKTNEAYAKAIALPVAASTFAIFSGSLIQEPISSYLQEKCNWRKDFADHAGGITRYIVACGLIFASLYPLASLSGNMRDDWSVKGFIENLKV